MRLETELYLLFRSLLKFIKNDNFLEHYQHLINLKKTLRKTLETLFDFGLVLGSQTQTTSQNQGIVGVNNNKYQIDFFEGMNKLLHKDARYGHSHHSKAAKTEEQNIIQELQNKIYLTPKKINKIINHSSQDLEYLKNKLNKLRLVQLKSELQLKCLQSELDLQKNCNVEIESRLNKIEDIALAKFAHLKKQIQLKVFDELRTLEEKLGTKYFISESKTTLSDIFKVEKQLYAIEGYKKHLANNANYQLPGLNQTVINNQSQFEKVNQNLIDQIDKLKRYMIDFDKMMNDVCKSKNDNQKQ